MDDTVTAVGTFTQYTGGTGTLERDENGALVLGPDGEPVVTDPVTWTETPIDPAPLTVPVSKVAPGGVVTCHAQRATTQADIDAGTVVNKAVVAGTDPAGRALTGVPSSAVVEAKQSKEASVTKAGTVADTNGDGKATVGEQVTYTLTVRNTGTVTLTDVSVKDPMLGTLTCRGVKALAPGDSATCSGVHVVTVAEAGTGVLHNVATVTSPQTGEQRYLGQHEVPTSLPPEKSDDMPALANTGNTFRGHGLIWPALLVFLGMMVWLRRSKKETSA